MNFLDYRISLDMHDKCSQHSLNAKQGDTNRRIMATLTEYGKPYHITDDCYAVFTADKPDGTHLVNACTIQSGTICYAFTTQTTAAAGVMSCEIKLYGSDGALITSPCFMITVDACVYNEGDEITSTSEYSALNQLILAANEAIQEAETATQSASNAADAANDAVGSVDAFLAGKSAYDIAVKNGFIGTEQDWLDSLEGEPGDDYVLTDADKQEIADIVMNECINELEGIIDESGVLA